MGRSDVTVRVELGFRVSRVLIVRDQIAFRGLLSVCQVLFGARFSGYLFTVKLGGPIHRDHSSLDGFGSQCRFNSARRRVTSAACSGSAVRLVLSCGSLS